VKVTVVDDVAEPGWKVAMTPPGSPDAVMRTWPVNPLIGVTVILLLVASPWFTIIALGCAEMVKSMMDTGTTLVMPLYDAETEKAPAVLPAE